MTKMKKLILLSILFIVGCSKTSTSSEPSCAELTQESSNATVAYQENTMDATLCSANVNAYQAGVDASCIGFTQAGVDLLQTGCNALSGVYNN